MKMGIQGQLLTHQGGTYLVQGGAMDGEGHPLTHTTRASPATVSNRVASLLYLECCLKET